MIKTPVAEDIRQLVISPHGNYMAILTTHTVHVMILPESAQLTANDTSPMKLKTYMLGSEIHVTSQSGIASALWHPLGVNGTCLVTVTEDAVVRVWELSVADRWSFEKPTLAIDLTALADGTSVDQDFSASMNRTKGYSPDSLEMEVAAACFASRESGGWSPMTLWIAMREGDVYALCPLLPEKWAPPPTLIPSLSVSIVAKVAAMEDDPEIPKESKVLAQQQLRWMSEIDSQEPVIVEAPGGEPSAEVFARPNKPGRVPKLQGPFDIILPQEDSENDLDIQLSDIFIIGAKLDAEELMFGEEDDLEVDDVDQDGLSMGIVCLLSSSGILSILLDMDEVQAQWLPKTKSKVFRFLDEANPPSLLTFDVLATSRPGEVWEGSWPVFSPDVNSRYSFYITATSSVTLITLPWVFRLEGDLNAPSVGAEFRMDLLAKGAKSIRERIYTHKLIDNSTTLAASVLMRDPDLGYFLLTATPYGPVLLTFESPEVHFDPQRSQTRSPSCEPQPELVTTMYEPRPVYEPSHALEQPSVLPTFLEKLRHGRYKRLLKEEVRLSPATLQIMTEAHKVLSEETHRLGTAAAELFRKCERLRVDLQDQIRKTQRVVALVDQHTGEDLDDEGPAQTSNEKVEERIQKAQEKQRVLAQRIEELRRKVTRGTSRELSVKERDWINQVEKIKGKIISDAEDSEAATRNVNKPWARYEQVEHLKEELLEQVKNMAGEQETYASPSMKVPSEIRKAKMTQIMGLLDRETALVEAAKSRLERLTIS